MAAPTRSNVLIALTLVGGVAAGAAAWNVSPGSAPQAHPSSPPVLDLRRMAASPLTSAADQPVAIFHAFNDKYSDVAGYVCQVGAQGYSHVQISPAQKSNPDPAWWARYQPVDYRVIEGPLGTEADLAALIQKAHGCGVRVIADVVFNHMANLGHVGLSFPGMAAQDFHTQCCIDYGLRDSVINCWLGCDLPDLDQSKPDVQSAHRAHLQKLVDLGIDGFRFDAAKHMSVDAVAAYIAVVNQITHGNSWNYLEVIEDGTTSAETYDSVATVTDFILYGSMKAAFSFGGDLRTLRVPTAVGDPRSVTFGRNHDQVPELNSKAINPYADASDSYLATAYVLAHASGTPLVLNRDNLASPFVPFGARFRQILAQRGRAGADVRENALGVIDSGVLLAMERGTEGLFVVNKAAEVFDTPAVDLTLTNLEGCYHELRNNFTIAIERRSDGKKYITRWGTWNRGGMQVQARDALYFLRAPWSECQ